MGALHAGHLSLVEKAREKASKTVASIFVNPTQFAPGEDFDTYPRDSEKDIAKLASVGCDLVYLPSVEEMYPPGNTTNVRVEGMSDLLDGVYRPHFFYGVATVVARLFLHVQPDVAVFGEKDYQQLQIIRRMVRDLGFPVDILGGATTRDADWCRAVGCAGRGPHPGHGIRLPQARLCQPGRSGHADRPAGCTAGAGYDCPAARGGLDGQDTADRQYQRDAVKSSRATSTASLSSAEPTLIRRRVGRP